MCWLYCWLCHAQKIFFLFFRPENQEVSVSRIGEDLVAIFSSIRSQGESNRQARFSVTFHPLLAAEPCNWHYFASLCLDSHVRYMTISMKIHRDHSLLWENKNLSRPASSAEVLLLSTMAVLGKSFCQAHYMKQYIRLLDLEPEKDVSDRICPECSRIWSSWLGSQRITTDQRLDAAVYLS